MKLALLISLLTGLLLATGATALALAGETGGATAAIESGAYTTEPGTTVVEPEDDLAAMPAVQTGLATVNGMEIRDPNPTCGVPFTVWVNAANQSGISSAPGTVALQNIHRGTGSINYTGSQNYPSMPPNGNYVVVFQVLINSYVSRGQELIASTNGSTFRLKYDISQGNCSKTSTPPPPGVSGQFLVARHSGKCLDVPGGSRNSVTPVQQYSCTGAENQTWAFEAVGDGFFRIVSLFSRMCLDVQGFSQQPQALVQQYPCNGGDNQSFSFQHMSGGYNLIVAKHSGLCLDVRGASTADLALIQQFPCHGNTNQQWAIR
jgi:hypothetical protein